MTCTCHPDDNPPRPCPERHALSECRLAASNKPKWNVCAGDLIEQHIGYENLEPSDDATGV